MIKLRSVYSIHSLWKYKRMLATYMRRMRNKNLEFTIAGSSSRPIDLHLFSCRPIGDGLNPFFFLSESSPGPNDGSSGSS